ncbi:Rna polymerase ii-associated protein [Thalictrum thalictroides]|uniref:Rna polymerase ii-associated protein n=1 Tax=Thalictrum thalictroides TaxID=46969 RepID=A0A7J6VPS2_THATH|nr:Rna polymerase ii-associated protein [Thalictrum thalictroides]
MARVPNKKNRDPNNLDFQGLYNDLQSWESFLAEKDKKLEAHSDGKGEVGSSSQRAGRIGGSRTLQGNAQQFDYSGSLKEFDRLSNSLSEESSPNAASEKDLGNDFFKQKKFKEAIDCYSRSIALSPTAVAFANRAMAYLKVKRFEEAENDCTEALNLDDRYIKAYSRRATARKELGKRKGSFEDSEFALRLEPQNQELKKQYAEAKAMYDKENLEKASRIMKNSAQAAQNVQTNENRIEEVESTRSRSRREESNGSQQRKTLSSGADSSKKNHPMREREIRNAVQELASRAASRAMAEAEKNITPPTSAYEFETSWKRLSGDRSLQACLLKAITPSTLPQLFKNSLSAPLLIDIIKCIATFFWEEMDLAINLLDSLTKVSRFDMIIMCLLSADKFDLQKMWEEVFSSDAVPAEYVEFLKILRSKYCP